MITFLTGFSQKQIEDPLTNKVRYLDKLVGELAKGKKWIKFYFLAACNLWKLIYEANNSPKNNTAIKP